MLLGPQRISIFRFPWKRQRKKRRTYVTLWRWSDNLFLRPIYSSFWKAATTNLMKLKYVRCGVDCPPSLEVLEAWQHASGEPMNELLLITKHILWATAEVCVCLCVRTETSLKESRAQTWKRRRKWRIWSGNRKERCRNIVIEVK